MDRNEKPGAGAGQFQNKSHLGADVKPRICSGQQEIRLGAANWKPYQKNTLQGFVDVEVCGVGLQIKGCTLHSRNGRRWVGFPGRAYAGKDGSQQWQSILEIADDTSRRAFQAAALKAIDRLKGGRNERFTTRIPFSLLP